MLSIVAVFFRKSSVAWAPIGSSVVIYGISCNSAKSAAVCTPYTPESTMLSDASPEFFISCRVLPSPKKVLTSSPRLVSRRFISFKLPSQNTSKAGTKPNILTLSCFLFFCLVIYFLTRPHNTRSYPKYEFPLKLGVCTARTGFSFSANSETTASRSSPIISTMQPERTTYKSPSITSRVVCICSRNLSSPPNTTSRSITLLLGSALPPQ